MSPTAVMPRKMGGMTLIEVLVAVLILSIGLLGLAQLEITVLRSNHSAYLRSQATVQAADLADRLLAIRDTALSSAGFDCSTNPECAAWASRIPTVLGAGATGTATRSGNEFLIRVTWSDARGNIRDGSGAAVSGDNVTFVYRTEL